jgi:hypothetical protein
MPHSDQEIAARGAQIEELCGLARAGCFGQLVELSLSEPIFILLARDELA